MNLTDTHCHLDIDQFDPDREAVLERAARAGVERILIPGLSVTSSRAVVKLAGSHPALFAAVGVHPSEASMWTGATVDQLRELARNSGKVVALGEIGLDYYWDSSSHELQQEVLEKQLDLAGELQLPVILHCREKGDKLDGNCAADLIASLKRWAAQLAAQNNPLAGRPGVLHSFSGSAQTARQAIDLNFFVGVTGPVTYRKERQEIVSALPLDHLLIETDAPFLTPSPLRPSPNGNKSRARVRNEPAYVRLIADTIAVLHHRSPEEIAETTSENAQRLFAWKK